MEQHDVCGNVIQQTQWEVENEFKKCIECGACYIDCPFDLWGTTDEERRQTVRDANDFIFNRRPITSFLKNEIFRCAECDKCFRPCPSEIHRKNANMLVKLRVKPKNVDRLKAHPARLRGTKQYLFEHLNMKDWSKDEKEWYDSLNQNRQADLLIYHGCYVASRKNESMKLEEMLSAAKLDFVTFGKFEYCCGNFGLYRGVQDLCATTPKIEQMISTVKPKEIITNCGHCREAVENVLSKMRLDGVKVLHPAEKLHELVLGKKLKLTPLDYSITIQDSCLYNLNQGDSVVRSLLGRVVDISENKDSLHKSLCCGDVAHVADPDGVHKYNERRIREFIETGADCVTVYCAGCNDIYDAFEEIDTKDLIAIVHESWQKGGENHVR